QVQGPPDSVCIIRLSAIGDCCHTVPVLRTLQSAWPSASFTWVIGATEAHLIGDIPGVEFVVLDKNKGAKGYLSVRRALRKRRFDVLLHMHASMRANLVSLLVSAPYRLGFDRVRARDRQWLFTNQRIADRPKQHAMDALFGFAQHLGVSDRVLRWDIPVSDADRSVIDDRIQSNRKSLIISPCSSQRFRNHRNWSAERYAAVADHAVERHDMQVVLTGGNSSLEREYAERIASLSQHTTVNLVGQTTLKQLLVLLERATAVLCPDSGPAHMATAVGTPVIGLYATSNPARTGPYLSQHWVVNKYPEAVAAQFGNDVDGLRWGTRVRNPQAMDLIQTKEVTTKLDQIIAGTTMSP
ncbi:MAG: glycosyltransferase family 9 protein, partial [Gammaproteobacteria bacterium]|nr:glycosyltransferase family 9 protein [Gammaproteobacteria bacterium]